MVLALKSLDPVKIPKNSTGPSGDPSLREFSCKHTFPTRVNTAEVAIKEFKLDQVGAEQPVDIVQVGARDVQITGSDKKAVEFVIRCRYKLKNPADKYTGEVTPLIIADVAT